MVNLFLDIETIPAPETELDKVKYLYQKLEAKRGPLKYPFEEYLKNTGFDGAFGQIVCIGYAMDDQPVEALGEKGENERQLLTDFWQIATGAKCFVGYNLIDFDMRFIWQRSVKLGVPPTVELNFARYRNSPMFDVMREWTKWGSQKDPGLEQVALALGLQSPKTDLDGSKVWDYYKAGKIKEICKYCKQDVAITRAIYDKMTFR
jgi:predicted PolB exonuclease-like 3'-5' exonuclease